jgi:hypothetical protein
VLGNHGIDNPWGYDMPSMLDKIFRDVPKLIKRSVAKRIPLCVGMNEWIDYCERLQPAKVWPRLRKLDYETDFERLSLWLTTLLVSEPPGRDINGRWFGLFNPCDDDGNGSSQLYLAGSRRFEKPDWPCNPEYFPESRYANSLVLPALYNACEKLKGEGSNLGEAVLCHGYVCLVLSRWARGPLREPLLGKAKSRALAFGHDSGDVYVVDRITR